MAKTSRIDVYERVNQKLVEIMESGVIPWEKEWRGGYGRAANLISKRPYSGINAVLLNCVPYESPWFVSYKQATDLGGHVRKGEKGHLAVFWKTLDVAEKQPDGTKQRKTIPLLRHYTVFNIDQCEDIPADKIPVEDRIPDLDFQPIEEAEKVIAGMPRLPEIRHIESRAYYSPSGDYVNMPKREAFTCEEAYYSVLFHELAHSTGHESRLCRSLSGSPSLFGSPAYSKEELIAEIASAFVCGFVGIDKRTLRNSAAYLQGWLKALRNDKTLFVAAAGKAQRAADFILAKGGQDHE